jgi:hypothetical protein
MVKGQAPARVSPVQRLSPAQKRGKPRDVRQAGEPTLEEVTRGSTLLPQIEPGLGWFPGNRPGGFWFPFPFNI